MQVQYQQGIKLCCSELLLLLLLYVHL